MMQVYINALQSSKTGAVRYVVEKGLSIECMSAGKSLLDALNSGYEVKAKCNSGVLEQDWRLTAESARHEDVTAAQVILGKIGIAKEGWETVFIHTQEFYDALYQREAVYMYIDLWSKNAKKPETFQITPKDRTVDADKYQSGQEMAQDILDILQHHSVKQDTRSLLLLLATKQNHCEN